MCDVACSLLPDELYQKIVIIEDQLGHQREDKWLPRKLDIDILLWGKNTSPNFNLCKALKYNLNNLCIPHQDFYKRNFLLNLSKNSLKIPIKTIYKHYTTAN